ncbi:MAG: hypothetical protein ACLTL6_16685 [Holdemanella porci]
MLGVIAGYVFRICEKIRKENTPVAAGIAAAVATVSHNHVCWD